jgi:DNA-binding MarR family transcriptional regulator
MKLAPQHEHALKLIAVGRSSLDHIVDTLQIDCQTAREIAIDLSGRGYIRQKGHLLDHAVTYLLLEPGRRLAETLLQERCEMAARFDILDDQWQVMSCLSPQPKPRRVLEQEVQNVAPGAMQSILAHLEERRLVRISGFFQVYARLSETALARMN